MKKSGTIIVVEDNRAVRTALTLLLGTVAARVLPLSSPVTLLSEMAREKPECVILDMNFSAGVNNGNEGLYWLERILSVAPSTPVILMTAYADIELAIRGIKAGAVDFVTKPWDNARMLQSVIYAMRAAKPDHNRHEHVDETTPFFGNSPRMTMLRELVDKVAATDASILITGENGTGKSLVAKYIHNRSLRRNKEMVYADMGAISETLFESEFFGHVKNAFTGASADRIGRFEAASGSTLFMDEIANIPLSMQSKLLGAIQERKIVKVGSNKPIDVDVRLISATSADVEAMVIQGRFRQDLLWRVNTIHIELPPLREREEDIIPLAQLFARKFGIKYGKPGIILSPSCNRILLDNNWPGNIRQLEHLMEKAVILSDDGSIGPELLDGGDSPRMSISKSIPMTLEEMERSMIADAIKDCDGNLSAVAVRLGITRQTLYNKIKRYGL